MPFVVVTAAVVIVNNGDDNAWRFVSVLSFVVFLLFYPNRACWQKSRCSWEETHFSHRGLHFVIVILSFLN